ncbi:Creatinine amidohydrolase [Dissulfuribacter thermophilus]|uniref:Creatinine amidohydrolase n=1 Tax=Dissulfuribacter thermophilus TaxID=1156395 RepID=A0A1B9F454_9BACT|nr:creatininase family protein [Dissulfuribacter thermophilus]OCC14604.1 Creatinine amidohydrolase [Dissulfuribacter thermophilus]
MDITRITMNEFEEGLEKTQTVIIPFGSVEEHGAHLPLGTDTMHAHEIALRTSQLRPVFVAPPIWYGLCRSTSEHPGTISIKGLTLRRLALDIIKAFYHKGLINQVLLSGHAGGTHMCYLVDAAEEAVNSLDGLKCMVLSIIDLVKDSCGDIVETPNDSHAGEVETSIIQAMSPELVRGTAPKEFPSFPKYLITREKRIYWQGGVWGDPSKATPEKGKNILDRESRHLSSLIDLLEGDP